MNRSFEILIFRIAITCCLTLLLNCEGANCANGNIYDALTNKPIDSVSCKVLTGSREVLSDSLGHFNVCNNFGGCGFKSNCGDIRIAFSKSGYKAQTITNPGKVIYLSK